MKDQNANSFPWQLCFSEWVGTALLVLIGLSLVILMFGTGSPIIGIVPSEGLRRLITGFLFGTTGALIALSPVGKESGAHINPVVTLGFWLMHKLDAQTALAMSSHVGVQVCGCPPLLAAVRWAGAWCSAPLCRVKAIPLRPS
jgi:aquaporin Z